MAYQIVAVNDAAPGACVDVGLTWNGSTTLTATQIIAGTAMTMSSTAAITGNTTIGGTLAVTGATTLTGAIGAGTITLAAGKDLIGSATSDITINTDKFTVAGATGNTVIAGTLTQTGAVAAAASITLGAGADLIGSSTSDITINTDKFTVAGATGNTVIAGTLTQTGAVAAAASITLGAGADLIGSSTSDITINTDKFTVAGATGNTVVAGTFTATGAQTLTGATTHSAAVGFGGTVVAAANGAYVIPLTTMVTNVSTNDTADLDASLADGAAGQLKIIVMDTDGGNDVVITPASFGNGTTLTLDTASDYAVFAFDGTEWWAISHSGTIA